MLLATVDTGTLAWVSLQALSLQMRIRRSQPTWTEYIHLHTASRCLLCHHHHCTAVVPRGWEKASACRLQVSLYCTVLCQIVYLQYLSRSSLHRLAGLPCRMVITWWRARSIGRIWGCRCALPRTISFVLILLFISMPCVLSPSPRCCSFCPCI